MAPQSYHFLKKRKLVSKGKFDAEYDVAIKHGLLSSMILSTHGHLKLQSRMFKKAVLYLNVHVFGFIVEET